MLFLIAILIAGAFAWFCAKPLKNHPICFYIGAAVLTVLMSILGRMRLQGIPAWANTYLIGIFTHGALAAALWCVVAWTGALPNGSSAMKRLMPVRGELSIFTAILTISHAVTYGITYVQRLISGRAESSADFVLTCIVSLLLMLIMIPLTVMSFKAVRRKMKPKNWKAIQRTAYLFYALIYAHVLAIYLPRARMGREGTFLSILVYTAVFVGYAVMRIRKALARKNQIPDAALNVVSMACFMVGLGGIGLISRPVNVPVRSAETVQETAETTEAPTSIEATETTHVLTETQPETVPETTSATTAETEEQSEETESETPELTEESTTQEVITEAAPVEEPVPVQLVPETPAPAEPEPTPEPEPVYIYNNGTYHVDIFGYDADEHFEITIENDVIIAIEGYCDESDPWYFDTALPVIRGSILAANSADIPDAVSGATISSNCIKNAVRQALEQARK